MSFRGRQRNRQSSIRPVHRIKHVIDSQQGATLGNQIFVTLAKSVDAPVLANSADVKTGSTINGIYLKVEVYATTSGALANAYLMVVKDPGTNVTFPNANIIGAFDLKRYVIHQEMVMLQKVTNSNPRTLFNGVIVIPRGYRRQGPDDRLSLFVFSPGVNLDVCVQCHYKEYQ